MLWNMTFIMHVIEVVRSLPSPPHNVKSESMFWGLIVSTSL
jgi:hypothetical protein